LFDLAGSSKKTPFLSASSHPSALIFEETLTSPASS
jgi:hypothetical protein